MTFRMGMGAPERSVTPTRAGHLRCARNGFKRRADSAERSQDFALQSDMLLEMVRLDSEIAFLEERGFS